LGADLRVRVQKLKNDAERLKSQLDMLQQQEASATQKTITQWRDELALVLQEIQDAHQRVTRKASASAPSSTPSRDSLPSTASFARGAELQPVSNRALLEQQKQTMRDIEESLTPLENTVANLGMVGNMINREIREQNTMLENTNAETDRVASRMTRIRAMVGRVGEGDKTRLLGCIVLVLTIILAVLLVKFFVP